MRGNSTIVSTQAFLLCRLGLTAWITHRFPFIQDIEMNRTGAQDGLTHSCVELASFCTDRSKKQKARQPFLSTCYVHRICLHQEYYFLIPNSVMPQYHFVSGTRFPWLPELLGFPRAASFIWSFSGLPPSSSGVSALLIWFIKSQSGFTVPQVPVSSRRGASGKVFLPLASSFL